MCSPSGGTVEYPGTVPIQPATHHQANSLRRRIIEVTSQLRQILSRTEGAHLYTRLVNRRTIDLHSKMELCRRMLDGPSIHIAMSWIFSSWNRAALSAMLVGDLCLGRHAAKFIARPSVPPPSACPHLEDSRRVCLYCWHENCGTITETEEHALMGCPLYAGSRQIFRGSLHADAIHSSFYVSSTKSACETLSCYRATMHVIGRL